MRLTVLGASGTYPHPGGACSGYLLDEDGFSLWIDAGTGTIGRLLEEKDIATVNALFLSHMHPDHFVDVYPFFFALSFHPDRPRGVPVYAPPGSLEFAFRLLSDDARDSFMEVFDWRETPPGDDFELGPFSVKTFDSKHSAPNNVSRIESGGKVFCYSGDTGPIDDLAVAARDADLFLCEASWQHDTEVSFGAIHLRAHEAGEVARAAGVDRLMLTHIWPTLDAEESRFQAEEVYGNAVDLAARGEGSDV
jgi:ribonuclease BN (tRNA processing enzyme)